MTVAHVQDFTGIYANSASATSTATVTAGSLLTCLVQNSSSSVNVTVSDNKGNIWTQDAYVNGSDGSYAWCSVWSAPNCAAGSTTVTVSQNDAYGRLFACSISEFSGVATSSYVDVVGTDFDDPIGANPYGVSGSGVTIASGSVGLLIFAFDRSPSGASATGYTSISNTNTWMLTGWQIFASGASGHRAQSSTGAAVFSGAALVAYKAAAGAATTTTLSGPSSGTTGVASTNFTVGANGTITGTVTVTPGDAGNGGTFTPTTVAISSGTPTATFTYTPASTGVKTISISDDGGLTDATSISYTSNAGGGSVRTPAFYQTFIAGR